jgi:hypothetical protein
LPPGLIGNPQALPACSFTDLVGDFFNGACPLESQLGYADFTLSLDSLPGPGGETTWVRPTARPP